MLVNRLIKNLQSVAVNCFAPIRKVADVYTDVLKGFQTLFNMYPWGLRPLYLKYIKWSSCKQKLNTINTITLKKNIYTPANIDAIIVAFKGLRFITSILFCQQLNYVQQTVIDMCPENVLLYQDLIFQTGKL